MGATGAGKTSIVSLLARFYDVQKGHILLDGVDIRELRLADLRRHVGDRAPGSVHLRRHDRGQHPPARRIDQ